MTTLKELIQFTFQSFWHFVGMFLILFLIVEGLIEITRIIFRK